MLNVSLLLRAHLILTLTFSGAVFLTSFIPTVSYAGPLGCAQAINGCVGGGKKVAEKIKAARSACEALRDCKTVCKDDKRDAKRDAKDDRSSCLKGCDKKSGKAKRSCKSSCKKEKRSDVREARGDKRDCVQECRDKYKTKACKKARTQMSLAIAGQSLKCAAKVTAQCVPPSP